MTASLEPSYFEALYARNPDPWQFATSDYEASKYAATLAALPRAAFARGFEVGCSIGVLTRLLAARCDALLSVDVAETALAQARARCADLPQVEFARMRIPHAWPDRMFDLIVLSEVLYYLTPADIAATATCVARSLAPDGAVVLVHWLGETDYPTGGDAAPTHFASQCGLDVTSAHRTDRYRLDVFARP